MVHQRYQTASDFAFYFYCGSFGRVFPDRRPEHRADDFPAILAADPFDALYQRRAGGRASH
jgi:hypothetical protein